MNCRLQIEDSAFVPGHAAGESGYILWPGECPRDLSKILTHDRDHAVDCAVVDQGRTVYAGPARVKRKMRYGSETVLVILLPGTDLGRLSRSAVIELDLATFD